MKMTAVPSPCPALRGSDTWAGNVIVRMRPSRLTLAAGFTIMELLITLTIGAILAVIAVPAMRGFLDTTRQSSALALLLSDLNQARGEAIKRNSRVLLCARDVAGTNCSAAAPPVWTAGWLVCTEGAVAEQCAASTATNPNPIVVRPALDPKLTLALTVGGPSIRFNANSSASAASSLALGGTWSGAATRTVGVANTGNISKQ